MRNGTFINKEKSVGEQLSFYHFISPCNTKRSESNGVTVNRDAPTVACPVHARECQFLAILQVGAVCSEVCLFLMVQVNQMF